MFTLASICIINNNTKNYQQSYNCFRVEYPKITAPPLPQSGYRSTMAPSLPTEIWRQIFQNLCIHCQQPKYSDSLPDFRLPCAREGKAALRNLCLVSRECRAMSQDVLFHFFYNLSNSGEWAPTTKDSTPGLLRALISNPCLAKQVRMMALFDQEQCWYDGITRQDLQSWSQVSRSHNIVVIDEIITALEPEGDQERLLYFDQSGPEAQLRSVREPEELRDVFYMWMYFLLIKIAPNLTHLQLRQPLGPFGGSFEDGKILAPAFPNVRVLSYNSFVADIKDVVHALAHFPNVSTFSCYDSLYMQDLIVEPISSGPMLNIRQLSISCWTDALSGLLKFCPHLEDLEFHLNIGSDFGGLEWEIEWPAHIKDNLRRLVWSDDDAGDLLGANSSNMLAPLMDFRCLEILEIDQASLLLNSRARTGDISRYVLPQTLRILHVAFAQEVSSVAEISDSLRELAKAKATYFPDLSVVKIDHPPPSPAQSQTLAEIMYETGILSHLEKAGIKLRFGLEAPFEIRKSTRRPLHTQRLVPLHSGSDYSSKWKKDYQTIHRWEMFSLEDLESL